MTGERMDKTLRIFMTIEEVPDISQRQLAKRTGFSLGTVNGILQKLIDSGEIVSKVLTPNHYIYELTEKGEVHKAKLLYDFTVDGYEIIGKIRKQSKQALEDSVKKGIRYFYLYGQEDAIYRLVKMSLIEYKRKADIDYMKIESFDEIKYDRPYKILVWNKETLELGGETLNVLIG